MSYGRHVDPDTGLIYSEPFWCDFLALQRNGMALLADITTKTPRPRRASEDE